MISPISRPGPATLLAGAAGPAAGCAGGAGRVSSTRPSSSICRQMGTIRRLAKCWVGIVLCGLVLAAPASAGSAFNTLFGAYRQTGTVAPCKYSAAELQSAQSQVPPDITQYAPDFPAALQAALQARARGVCGGGAHAGGSALPTASKPSAPAPPSPAGVTPAPTRSAGRARRRSQRRSLCPVDRPVANRQGGADRRRRPDGGAGCERRSGGRWPCCGAGSRPGWVRPATRSARSACGRAARCASSPTGSGSVAEGASTADRGAREPLETPGAATPELVEFRLCRAADSMLVTTEDRPVVWRSAR